MGKRKRGDMEVIAIGTASVSHHKNTHERTASMFLLACFPLRSTKKNMSMHARGPKIMKSVFEVRIDLRVRWELSGGVWMGRSGALGSSELGCNALSAIGEREVVVGCAFFFFLSLSKDLSFIGY